MLDFYKSDFWLKDPSGKNILAIRRCIQLITMITEETDLNAAPFFTINDGEYYMEWTHYDKENKTLFSLDFTVHLDGTLDLSLWDSRTDYHLFYELCSESRYAEFSDDANAKENNAFPGTVENLKKAMNDIKENLKQHPESIAYLNDVYRNAENGDDRLQALFF